MSFSEALFINADRAQLEQVLLNLIKNAHEAQNSNKDLEQHSTRNVEVQMFKTSQQVVIKVLDQGCGIANSANLFVPFYTTKAKGSGIGLALSRQIITNHKGELSLANRTDKQGAVAVMTLPFYLC